MNAAPYIPGFPDRLGKDLAALMEREGFASKGARFNVINRAQSGRDAVPLTADEESISNAADRASRECYEAMTRCITIDAGLMAVTEICARWDVDEPDTDTGDKHEIINKVVDMRWWKRQLRKAVARRVEHAAIKCGIVGKGAQPYLSDESVIRQVKRNKANRKALKKVEMVNEHGEIFNLADLADKGVGNKEKRRHELMTRIRGFEEVAMLLNHAAVFWTVTAPSKFHAVGGKNPKYSGASPRDAQRYLCDVWARIRAQLDREGIQPYGFRVVEPHTDGCPHWHMLFFVERKDVQRMAQVIYEHALREDGDEPGAKENRVKLVNIEHGKGGSAAAYIAKYISKNIDGTGVGDYTSFDEPGAGETVTVKPQVLEKMVITPAMRVSCWAQVWGIRQFQQIGGVPVGIWREFRRIQEEEVQGAPESVLKAWEAVQAEKDENGDVVKQADFAAFMQALGGPRTGRETLVKLAKNKVRIKGRYAVYQAEKPVGVYAVEDQTRVYKSVRYEWTRLGESQVVPFGFPRTGVNNCTEGEDGIVARAGTGVVCGPRAVAYTGHWLKKASDENAEKLKNQKICSANLAGWWDRERTALKPDIAQVEKFIQHRKKGPVAGHLDYLRAKYREG